MGQVESRAGDHNRQFQLHDALPVVSSRQRVLERLSAVLRQAEAGPVLLTGEAGAGKSWLTRRLAEELPAGWRTLTVDLSAAMNALELLRLIGHSLGVSVGNRLGAARLLCQDALEDEAAEDRSWILVLDEAHRASPSAWDEIRTIANRQARAGGFGAVILLGRTPLARAITAAGFGGFAPGLLLHLHLWPLDLDEARELLGGQFTDEEALEQLHRDAQGNPGMLLRLARTRSDLWQPPAPHSPHHIAALEVQAIEQSSPPGARRLGEPARTGEPISHRAVADSPPKSTGASVLPLIPTKPPLRIEEGLVEVGWDGDLAAEFDETDDESASSHPVVEGERSYHEEPIQDHYAALQARAEQARNQARQPDVAEGATAGLGQERLPEADEVIDDTMTEALAAQHHKPEPALPASGIRAEGQHEFAPYSQLFNRLRHSKS